MGLSLGLGRLDKRRPDLPTDLGSYATNEKIIPSLSLNYNTERVRSNPDYDIVNKVYQNVGTSTQSGLEVTAEQQVLDAWRVAGAVNWFVHDVDALETTLYFPTTRPFTLAASRDDTWDVSVNNRFLLPWAAKLQLSYLYYAERNVPQGRERARSSMDLAASLPIRDERAEVVFTFTELFNNFAIRRDIDGIGFTALYENYLETQVATVGVKVRF